MRETPHFVMLTIFAPARWHIPSGSEQSQCDPASEEGCKSHGGGFWREFNSTCLPKLTYPLLKVLLKMISLFPRWEMWSFPGGYIPSKLFSPRLDISHKPCIELLLFSQHLLTGVAICRSFKKAWPVRFLNPRNLNHHWLLHIHLMVKMWDRTNDKLTC